MSESRKTGHPLPTNAVQIPAGDVRGSSIIEMVKKHDSTGPWAFREAVVATTDPSDAVQADQRES